RRRGADIAGADGKALLPEAIGPFPLQNDEQLFNLVMHMEREGLAARLDNMEHAANAFRADTVAEGARHRLETLAIAGLTQFDIGKVDNRTRFHHPTLPSRLMPINFCASTANSIGSSWITSRTNPFTIS